MDKTKEKEERKKLLNLITDKEIKSQSGLFTFNFLMPVSYNLGVVEIKRHSPENNNFVNQESSYSIIKNDKGLYFRINLKNFLNEEELKSHPFDFLTLPCDQFITYLQDNF